MCSPATPAGRGSRLARPDPTPPQCRHAAAGQPDGRPPVFPARSTPPLTDRPARRPAPAHSWSAGRRDVLPTPPAARPGAGEDHGAGGGGVDRLDGLPIRSTPRWPRCQSGAGALNARVTIGTPGRSGHCSRAWSAWAGAAHTIANIRATRNRIYTVHRAGAERAVPRPAIVRGRGTGDGGWTEHRCQRCKLHTAAR